MTEILTEFNVSSLARAYIAAGISVVPIKLDGSKAPAVPSWKAYQKRLPTAAECACWFERADPFGLAVIGGAVSGGLEILDFDEDAEHIFPAWRAEVEKAHPGLYERLRIISTPRAGFHVLYRCPQEDIPGNTKLAYDPAAKAVLIETRGEGGYAITTGSPPACHPSGQRYVTLSGPDLPPPLSPDERDTLISLARSFDRRVEMPTRVVGTDMRPGDAFEREGPDWSDILETHGWRCVHGAMGGERRWRRPGKETGWSATTGRCRTSEGADLFHVFSSNAEPFEAGKTYGKFRAYALLKHGGDLAKAAADLARQGYGSAPQPKKAKAEKSESRPTAPKPLPSYDPFPLSALPVVMRDYVGAAAESIGCDPALVALPALAVVASCIGTSRAVILRRGWTEPAIIWAATIAASGAHKSPAFARAVDPLMALQMDLVEAHRQKISEYQEAKKNWRPSKSDEGGATEPQEPPSEQCLITTETTIESVGQLLRDNPRGILMARDELDGWFQSMTRYKSGGGTDRPHWLELSRGGSLRIHRVSRPPLSVRRACCSVCGTIQPAILADSLSPKALAAGLGARFLMAMPPRRPRRWTEAEVATELCTRWRSLLENLLALKPEDTGERRPRYLAFAGDAKMTFVSWFDRWGARQDAAHDAEAAALAKLEGYAARLALIHHVVTQTATEIDDGAPISLESVRGGVRLAEWFAAEAIRVYQVLRESVGEKEQRELLEWISTHGGEISVRDVLVALRSRYGTAESVRAALDELVAAQAGEWVPAAAGPKGGRPSERFRLCAHKTTKLTNPPPPSELREEYSENYAEDEGGAGFCGFVRATSANGQHTREPGEEG
jgi:hypothetical protein